MRIQNAESRTDLGETVGALGEVSEKSREAYDVNRPRAFRREETMPPKRFRPSDFARWLMAGLMLAYGITTFSRDSPTWAIGSLVVFAVPLALQCTRWVMLRTYALWLAGFLILQALQIGRAHV